MSESRLLLEKKGEVFTRDVDFKNIKNNKSHVKRKTIRF